MIRRIPGAFRVNSDGIENIADSQLAVVTAGSYTKGATLLDQIPIEQYLGSNPRHPLIQVLAISVTAVMAVSYTGTATYPYGKFGSVLAGITNQGNQTSYGAASQTYVPGILGFPADSSLVSALWDPSVNSLPPALTSSQANLLPVAVNNVLPQPLELQPGGNLLAGLWMKPSLLAGDATEPASVLTVLRAVYSLTIDDGR